MDRNSVIGMVLIGIILIGYSWFTAPSAEEMAHQEQVADSLAHVEVQRTAEQATDALAENATPIISDTPIVAELDIAAGDSAQLVQLASTFGIFHPSGSGNHELFTLENDKIELQFHAKGGSPKSIRLKEYQTYQGDPQLLADPDSNRFEYRFFLNNLDLSTNDLYFKKKSATSNELRLRAETTSPSKYIELIYTLTEGSYLADVRMEINGLEKEIDPANTYFQWEMLGLKTEKHLPTQRQKSTIYFKYFNDDRDYLSEGSEDMEELEGRTNWVAFKQDFFSIVLISKEGFVANGSEIEIVPLEDTTHTKQYIAKLYFDKDRAAKVVLPMQLFLGPNHYQTLRSMDVDQIDRIIDLGWGIFGWMNRFLVIPIFNWLDGWGWNYGIIILVLTLVIKMMLVPLTYKNYKSSSKMRVLKPEMDAITEKYKDGDAMKKQQAVMDLYRSTGVNPASGCLPMLVQMPILYAMFRFFPSSIELRQESFLWADDLSSYDSIMDLPFTIPMYGDHISLFTLLMAISTIIYTQMNSSQMPTQAGMPNMKVMMWIFPIMMLFFLNNFSAGLSYYYLLANLISITQMFVIKKYMIDEDKIRMQLEQNKKTRKGKKKSKFQQRLMEAAKQREQQMKQRGSKK